MSGRAAEKPNTAPGLCLCGAYGMGSCGDEAMLSAVLAALHTEYPEAKITVISHTPDATAKKYGVRAVHTFDAPRIVSTLKESRALIFGGGSILQTKSSRRSLYYYLWLMRQAERHNNEVIFYGCGFGPMGERDAARCAEAINRRAGLFCARDRLCYDTLLSLGVREEKLVLSADPALAKSPSGDDKAEEFLKNSGVFIDSETVVFCVKDGADAEEVKNAVQRLTDMGQSVVFAILNTADEKITRKLSDKLPVLPYTEDISLLAAVFKRAKGVVSMRLHALVAAYIAGTGFTAVGDDPKLKGFAEYSRGGFCVTSFSELDKLPLKADADTERLRAAEKNNISAAADHVERKYDKW